MAATFIALPLTWPLNKEPLLIVLLSSEPRSHPSMQLQSLRVISSVTLGDTTRKLIKEQLLKCGCFALLLIKAAQQ